MKKLLFLVTTVLLAIAGAHAAAPDLSKVRYTIGEGDNSYLVVLRFDQTKKIDNLVFCVKSNNANIDAYEALKMLPAADPRIALQVSMDGQITISYKLIGGENVNNQDFDESKDIKQVSVGLGDKTFASDGKTPVFTFSPEFEDASKCPYFFYVPAPTEVGVWLPDAMTVKLSDEGCVLPCFVQVPNGMLNSVSNWQASSSNTSYVLDRKIIISPYTRVDQNTYNAIPTFTGATGTTYVRYRPQYYGTYGYYESNFMTLTVEAPAIPMTSIKMKNANVTAGLNKEVPLEYTFEPANATYTAVGATVGNTTYAAYAATTGLKTKTAKGSTSVTVYSLYDNNVKDEFTLTCELIKPVAGVNFGPGTEDGVINVPVKQLIGLRPTIVPADADIQDVTITLSNNGTSNDNMTCSTYKVNYWDQNMNNARVQFFELSGHRPTGDNPAVLNVKSADGAYEKNFIVNVIESDRTPLANGYTDGTIILNEEWFGHTNGGLNYITPDNEIIYQAYERENPGQSFGCTSQYGVIWADKLIVISKQPDDGGDKLRGGGCVVIADAKTLKKIGGYYTRPTFDGKTGDGRAVAGATPDKIYVSTSNGIYVMDITNVENPVITGHLAGGDGNDLYNGQVGDIINGGRYVYSVMQSVGILCIDPLTDKVVKTIQDANAQGITQTSDGTIWYATVADSHSVFVGLNPETLDEIKRVNMPAEIGVVACGWGAWRSTPFKGDYLTGNLWFTTGAGSIVGGGTYYYRFNPMTDDPSNIKEFFSLANVTGTTQFGEVVNQMNYGTSIYDPRNNRLIVMATQKGAASGQYRNHWIHFVSGENGTIEHTMQLNPYYWFQSLPILPDVQDVTFNLDTIETGEILINLSEGDQIVDLTNSVSDPDNIDSNILLTLEDTKAPLYADDQQDEPTAVFTLKGRKLTMSPKAEGVAYFTLGAGSNGRKTTKTFTVKVSKNMGVSSASRESKTITCSGNQVHFRGFAGTTFELYAISGQRILSINVDDNDYIARLGINPGIYVLRGSDGSSSKLYIY